MAVWKIAPGEDAEDWDHCQQYRCIGLGWMALPNYRHFENWRAVRAALKKAYPKKPNGNRDGAARSICYFAHDVQECNIVVANEGRSRVIGIGVVESDYLTPRAAANPIPPRRSDDDMWRRHARCVDWRITQAIDLDDTYFFGIGTVSRLSADRVCRIRDAYLTAFPQLQQVLDELFDDELNNDEVDAGADQELADAEEQLEDEEFFDPTEVRDARNRVVRSIVERRGQSAFRNDLLTAYRGRCVVTGCDVKAVLEAAHIVPYRGTDTNHLGNGLLLRADVHTLFDLNLMGIEPHRLLVSLHPAIGSDYAGFAGQPLRCRGSQRPSPEALRWRYQQFQQRRDQPV
jgi:hypothetical protein